MGLLFSVIIPVYNGLEHDLPRCLDSVWSQPIDAGLYEVLCVDDVSTDGSRQWITEQTAIHANLRLIENEANRRQGGARNHGMQQARGRYIVFIDQDDYFHPGALAKTTAIAAEGDLDVLVVDNSREVPGKVNNEPHHRLKSEGVVPGREFIVHNAIPYSPWNYIFRRSLALDGSILFVEHERIEDVDWVHRLLLATEKVGYYPHVQVHNIIGSGATTMTAHLNPDTVYSYMRASSRLYALATTQTGEVANCIARAGYLYFYWGLRQCLFFSDKAATKARHIKANASPHIHRLATSHPLAFTRLTNLLSPLVRPLMKLWRRFRYT